MLVSRMLCCVALLVAAPAGAEVVQSAADRFELTERVIVPVPPAEAYVALGRIGDWWDPQHSYSGKAANMRLELKAGGCFCETLPDGGSVEHGRVVQARPGELLRLFAALGPLQEEPVDAVLTWTLKAVPQGTEITQHYLIGGPMKRGGAFYAPHVDQVMTTQLGRLKTLLAR